MKEFKRYIGAILIILAALVLIVSYFKGWNNFNGVQVGSFAAMIVGLLLHIFINKKNY